MLVHTLKDGVGQQDELSNAAESVEWAAEELESGNPDASLRVR